MTKSKQSCCKLECYFHWLPQWLGGEQSACSAGDGGDMVLIPGSGRSSGGGNGNPLQYSCQENPMNRGVCWLLSVRSQRVGHDEQLSMHTQEKAKRITVLIIYYTLHFDFMFKPMQIHSNTNYFFQDIYEAGLITTVFSMCRVK